MASAKGRGRTVLGLFVDGLDVKLAHLTIRKKRVSVEELRSATLVAKLADRKVAEDTASSFGDATDAFNLNATTAAASEIGAETQTEDNNAVLIGLLAQYPRNKYSN